VCQTQQNGEGLFGGVLVGGGGGGVEYREASPGGEIGTTGPMMRT